MEKSKIEEVNILLQSLHHNGFTTMVLLKIDSEEDKTVSSEVLRLMVRDILKENNKTL